MTAPRGDSGFTLIEALIASILTLVVLIMGYEILNSTTSSATAVSNRSLNEIEARNALTAVEANLRFADGVWVCTSETVNSTNCSDTAGATGSYLVVTNTVNNATSGSNDIQPACVEWSQVPYSSSDAGTGQFGLLETSSGATSAVARDVTSASFTLPSIGTTATQLLVETTLTVNREVANEPAIEVDAADAVTVSDFVAPDDLPAALGSTTSPTLPSAC